MIEGQIARARKSTPTVENTILTKAEIEAMQVAATEVNVPPNVMKALTELRTRAEAENLTISVRRLFEGVKLMQAAAALTKRDEVTTEDMKVFEHVLWSDPEDHGTAYQLTLEYAGAVAKKAAQLRTEFEEQQTQLTELQANMPADGSMPTSELMGDIGKVSNLLTKSAKRVKSAIEDAESEGHETSELDALLSDIKIGRESVKKMLTPRNPPAAQPKLSGG